VRAIAVALAVDQALPRWVRRERRSRRAARAGAAHVSGTDIQARLMRSLAALDAARRVPSPVNGMTDGFSYPR
jgi:hypothetical protein